MKATYTETEYIRGKWSSVSLPRDTVAERVKLGRLMSGTTCIRIHSAIIISWPHDLGVTIFTRDTP